LSVESGGRVNAPNCTLNKGSIQVRGRGATVDSLLKITSDLDIGGQNGSGNVVIESGGGIDAHKVLVGDRTGTGGETVTVAGVDDTGLPSTLSVTGSDGELHVAGNAATQIEVKDGGSLSTFGVAKVGENFAVGKVLVHGRAASGQHSSWDMFGKATIGGQITPSELIVEEAGHVTCNDQMALGLGAGEQGKATIEGDDSLLNTATLVVGSDGHGELDITNGAHVQSTTGIVGQSQQAGSSNPAGPGSGLVSIVGDAILGSSEWHVTGDCFVATDEPGQVALQGLLGGAKLLVDGSLTVGAQGIITGVGSLTAGRVFNHGFIRPGLSPGEIDMEGDYEQAEDGVLEIEIAGLDEGQFDVLKVTGDATLGGTLKVHFLSGFLPKSGDSVDFLQVSGKVTGNFSQITFPEAADGFNADLVLTSDGKLRLTARSDAAAGSGTSLTPPENLTTLARPATACGSGACGAGLASLLPLTAIALTRMRRGLCQRGMHPRNHSPSSYCGDS
jgi:T5SS/PEP-CTERM-associated repeat protein